MKILLPTLLFLASGLALRVSNAGQPSAVTAAPEGPFQPGPEHARLQQTVGTWAAVIVAQDPAGAEQRTQGTLTTTAHTAFHTLDSFEGEFMGMKFVGHGMNGYCTVRKKYFTYWTDSMTSSPMTVYGDYDAQKHELTQSGECLGMSGKLEPCRTVTLYQDADHYSWAMYGAGPDGKEIQQLRIEYTRKK